MAYSIPEPFAKNYPYTWEPEEFKKEKYPPNSTFIPGFLDPSWRPRTTMAPRATHTYAQAVPSPTKAKKGRQAKPPALASSVAVTLGEAFMKPPPQLPQVVCRFFASRTTLKPHPEALRIAASFPDIITSVLREENCSLPLSLSCTVNIRGSVSLLGVDHHTAASAYTTYFTPLTTRLSIVLHVGNSLWELFKHAQHETLLLIHSIPLAFLPTNDHQLFPSLDESI